MSEADLTRKELANCERNCISRRLKQHSLACQLNCIRRVGLILFDDRIKQTSIELYSSMDDVYSQYRVLDTPVQ